MRGKLVAACCLLQVSAARDATGMAASVSSAESRSSEQPAVAATRNPQAAPRDRRPGSRLTVYLMTMGQGDEVWELFGHNAIWISDGERGTELAYNWGMFDFAQPGFLPRFLSGDMMYWMEPADARATVELYRRLNRSVWIQELDLSPEQRLALRSFVEWNAMDENRFYHYDYFLDNCSTRVRDAIDRAIGGQLKQATTALSTGTTFRWHTRRLTQRNLPVYAGIMLALGQPADRPISAWEEMFLPGILQQRLRTVRITDDSGRARPLVKSEQQLFAATRPPDPDEPPRYLPYFLGAGVLVGGLIVVAARRARAEGRRRRLLGTMIVTWHALIGIVGVVLLLAWLATRHVFWYRNENLLQANPLALILALSLPFALARRGRAGGTRVVAVVVAALAALGLLLKATPWYFQVNAELIALTLPIHLAAAWAVATLAGAAPDVAVVPSRPGVARRKDRTV